MVRRTVRATTRRSFVILLVVVIVVVIAVAAATAANSHDDNGARRSRCRWRRQRSSERKDPSSMMKGLYSPYREVYHYCDDNDGDDAGTGDNDPSREGSGGGCPRYGCPLLPRDVAFDDYAKEALETLRALGGEAATHDDEHDGCRDEDEDEDEDGQPEATRGDASAEVEWHKGYSPASSSSSSRREAMLELASAGDGASATLTLVGYKGGGSMSTQINQDRAFVLSPFLIPRGGGGSGSGSGSDGGSEFVDGTIENPQDGTQTAASPVESGSVTDVADVFASDMGSKSDGRRGWYAQLLGVFDGHASNGELVSDYVVTRLPELLSTELGSYDAAESGGKDVDTNNNGTSSIGGSEEKGDDDDDDDDDVGAGRIGDILTETFRALDSTAPAQNGGGCTASVVLRVGNEVYVANAGDSRSFLVAAYVPPARPASASESTPESDTDTDTKEARVRILFATREDKPHLPDERSRIESSGGTVSVPPPERLAAGSTSRVMYADTRTGMRYGLAMSRSIGDWDAGRYGVIPDPIVRRFDLDDLVSMVVEGWSTAGLGEEVGAPAAVAEVDVDEGGETKLVTTTTTTAGDLSGCLMSSSPSSSCRAAIDPSRVRIFAVSATDGLLDYIPPDVVATHVARGLYGIRTHDDENEGRSTPLHLLTACEDLIATAAAGWHRSKGGRYRDDIAIAVSNLV